MLLFLAAFTALLALYFAIAEAPFPIKHDMAEAYAWGHEFQLGYNQHPPFWAWLCGAWFLVWPRTEWAFGLLSALNAAIGLCGAWVLIGDFAEGLKRMAAWVLLLTTPIYTFYAYKYDANTIFLSLWPWTLHYFIRSWHGRRLGDAVAFGVLAGLCMMSKYYALILFAACLLAVLQDRSRWRYLGSASPYVAALVALAVFAPHLWWLLANRAPPIRYLDSLTGWRFTYIAWQATRTFFGALGMNLGVVLIVAVARWKTRDGGLVRAPNAPTIRTLATLTFVPLLLTVVSALALRATSTVEMTIGTFPLFPLLAIEVAGLADTAFLCRIGAWLAGLLTLGAVALSPLIALERAYLSPEAMKAQPLRELAVAATKLWHERIGLPVAYVAGSDWLENGTVFYSPDRPEAFVHFDYARNLWVTPADIARRGLLSVCRREDKACLDDTARFATPRTTRTELTLAHRFWGHVARPVHFVVTIIPPRAD